MRSLTLAIVVALGACTPNATPPTASSDAGTASSSPPNTSVISSGDRPAPDASVDAKTEAAKEEEPPPSYEKVAEILSIEPNYCASSLAPEARLRCLFDARYSGDKKAADLAWELWTKWKIVAGVDRPHTMNGGYRGMIKIEPATPMNADRSHLEWIVTAFRDFEQFFDDLAKYGRDASKSGSATTGSTKKFYRWHPVTLRFFRSVAARTPSAYAQDWMFAYNLVGSLNKSADAVRETVFHELFHVNDLARPPHSGESMWSEVALVSSFSAVSKKCGTAIPCLTPYTPTDTVVRGGTYYAFQPGNGNAVVEYAAELATRFYRENRAIFRGLPRSKSFKCGPPENGRAWIAMRDEWFGGIDAVPACP